VAGRTNSPADRPALDSLSLGRLPAIHRTRGGANLKLARRTDAAAIASGGASSKSTVMTALPPWHSFAGCRRETAKEVPRGLVLREDLGSEPSDASITGSGHQGSHEFARHAAMLLFVGHEDRDLSGARAYGAHGSDATVIDRDHPRASDDRCDM